MQRAGLLGGFSARGEVTAGVRVEVLRLGWGQWGWRELWRRWTFQLELVWKWRLRALEVIKVTTLRFPGEP